MVLAVVKLFVVLLNRQKHTEPDVHLSFWLQCCHAHQQVFFTIAQIVLSKIAVFYFSPLRDTV